MSSSPGVWPANSKMPSAEVASARRHVFLCGGPDGCAPEDGLASWDWLKRRMKELGAPALRTKAACLRVCAGGPWAVVDPKGTWYGAMTPERLERVLCEHALGGRPVEEWAVARTGCGKPRSA